MSSRRSLGPECYPLPTKATWALLELSKSFAAKYGGPAWRETQRNIVRPAMGVSWSVVPLPQSPLGPHPYPLDHGETWLLIGPLPTGESILVVVDYYSRYYEVDILKSTVASKVISSLEEMFARHGLPESLTSDNGPQFISAEFAEYMVQQGIRHHKVTAKWPQANGEVECQNSSLLKRLQIAHAEKKN